MIKKSTHTTNQPLCHPYDASLHCLSSEARFPQELIRDNQLLAVETPHPGRLYFVKGKFNILLSNITENLVGSHHGTAAPSMRDTSPSIVVGGTKVGICLRKRKQN